MSRVKTDFVYLYALQKLEEILCRKEMEMASFELDIYSLLKLQ